MESVWWSLLWSFTRYTVFYICFRGPDIDDDRADDSDSGEDGVDGDGGDDHHPRGASHGKWSAKHSDGERLIKSICAKVEGQIFSFR